MAAAPGRLVVALTLATALGGLACPAAPATEAPDPGVVVGTPDGGHPAQTCSEDQDCAFGERCQAGLCQPPDRNPHDEGCWVDADCPAGHLCAVATGRCVPEAAQPEPPPPAGACEAGQTRPCGSKVGQCEYGVQTCVDGAWAEACVGGVPAVAERCDGLDNDCDGAADEDFALGAACSAGQGACLQHGVTVCVASGDGVACGATPLDASGRVELCANGEDDNCDGDVDEGFAALDQRCEAGVGACRRSGVWVCASDLSALRCTAVPASPGPVELCGDSVDNNCDGQVNEGYAAEGEDCLLGSAPCQVPGLWTCNAARDGLRCVPLAGSLELCNGLDDDEDQCVDEDFDLGAPCAAGLGVCRAIGAITCSADATGTACSATPGPADPAGERCGNGLDDDCDGELDEGYAVGDPCSAGLGICARSGALICAADGLSTTCDAVPGLPDRRGELCGNGRDDDCDGATDEGFGVGDPCTVGTGVCARPGTLACRADGLGTVCSGTPGAPDPAGERCGNGLDDDCDGYTDEGFGNLGSACTAGTGVCRTSGIYVCQADGLGTVCNAQPGSPGPELCDDLDNDCNSVVDNGCDDDGDDYCDASLALVGVPLVCPRSNSAALRDCNDADPTVHPGATELCGDSRDQDCDGDPSNGCAACDPAVDADFDGSNQCLDCDDLNGAVHPGATERCDGVDNDCDGTLDEGFDGDGDGYTTCGTVRPAGGLDPSLVDCDDASAARHPGACELCAQGSVTVACGAPNDRGNNVDEDCDGWVDELCYPCNPADQDGDGLSECDGDCAPLDGTVNPLRAEVCDGKDTDCNAFTVDNCGVGDTCNWPTADTDLCRDRLICVESLGPSGNGTGDYTCTSFCNTSRQGAGLGDGCASDQTCGSSLTPTANLHGCALSSAFGSKVDGETCNRNTGDVECRSGYCMKDDRSPPAVYYCSDYCGSDGYCVGSGTSCQLFGSYAARCYRTFSFQTRGVGESCADNSLYCRAGPQACVEFSAGNRRCSAVCCKNGDCPAGYRCALEGGDYPGPVGGYDTAPICWPLGTGSHDRQAGAACTGNGQCASEFCDATLRVCVDLCCHDATCPQGLRCEAAVVTRRNGHQTYARACLNLTPDTALEALP